MESLQDVADAARIAELAGISDSNRNDAGMNELMDEVRANRTEVQLLASKVGRMTINVARSTLYPQYLVSRGRNILYSPPQTLSYLLSLTHYCKTEPMRTVTVRPRVN